MTIAEAFNSVAERYDLERRRLVPCFDGFYGAAVGALTHRRDAAIDVLDLGAGTGLLSRYVLDSFPNARLTLVDIAEDMLARAKERFADLSATVAVHAMDYASEPLEGDAFDAVVSALSVHHLTDEATRSLFARIHGALRPGGVFVNADQVLGATPALQSQHREDWLARVRTAGASAETIAQTLQRMEHDCCAPLVEQLRWLELAGFEGVDVPFKDMMFAVMRAEKP